MTPRLVGGVLILPPGWDAEDLRAWRKVANRNGNWFNRSRLRGGKKVHAGQAQCSLCGLTGHTKRQCKKDVATR